MNLLTMISGKTDLWNIPHQYLIGFEDMQKYSKSNECILINTLKEEMQHCLILNTIHAKQEVSVVEKALRENKPFVIYGMHHYDASLVRKYQQLKKLGAVLIYVYGGGMFEWLLLQDIYGNELFTTSGKELSLIHI